MVKQALETWGEVATYNVIVNYVDALGNALVEVSTLEVFSGRVLVMSGGEEGTGLLKLGAERLFCSFDLRQNLFAGSTVGGNACLFALEGIERDRVCVVGL